MTTPPLVPQLSKDEFNRKFDAMQTEKRTKRSVFLCQQCPPRNNLFFHPHDYTRHVLRSKHYEIEEIRLPIDDYQKIYTSHFSGSLDIPINRNEAETKNASEDGQETNQETVKIETEIKATPEINQKTNQETNRETARIETETKAAPEINQGVIKTETAKVKDKETMDEEAIANRDEEAGQETALEASGNDEDDSECPLINKVMVKIEAADDGSDEEHPMEIDYPPTPPVPSDTQEVSSTISRNNQEADRVTCPDCNRSYKNRLTMRRHQIEQHTSGRPRVTCPDCGKAFIRKYNLKLHIEQAYCKANVPCHICGLVFSTRDRMNQHATLVHGQSRLPCQHCDQVFSREEYLLRHMKLDHMELCEEYKWFCKYCGRAYRSRGGMYYHISAVHGDLCKAKKAYKPKGASGRGLHWDGARWNCKYCDSAFITKGGAYLHFRVKHEEQLARSRGEALQGLAAARAAGNTEGTSELRSHVRRRNNH